MTGDDCRRFQGALAMRALGRDDELDAALDDHLERCADCRAELLDLSDAATAVLLVEPASPQDTSAAPFDLGPRIIAHVNAEASRRRWRRVAAIAAALVVFLAGGAMLFAARDRTERPDTAATTTVTLAGTDGAATATLVGHAWGTEVALQVQGLSDGEVYWLWLTGEDGQRVGAGTLTGTGTPMHAVLASALAAGDARRIWITNESDEVVLDALIPAPS